MNWKKWIVGKSKGQLTLDGLVAVIPLLFVLGIFIAIFNPVAENFVIPQILNLAADSQPGILVFLIRLIPIVVFGLAIVSIFKLGTSREPGGFGV